MSSKSRPFKMEAIVYLKVPNVVLVFCDSSKILKINIFSTIYLLLKDPLCIPSDIGDLNFSSDLIICFLFVLVQLSLAMVKNI